jgi:hypothetical protein
MTIPKNSGHILLVNAGEAIGPDARPRAARLLADARAFREPRVALDGRLQPHEWIASNTALLKVDALDRYDDDFFPGSRDIAWDVAGAIVEFRLNHSEAEDFVSRYAEKSGDSTIRRRRPFYEAAYPGTGSATRAWQPKCSEQRVTDGGSDDSAHAVAVHLQHCWPVLLEGDHTDPGGRHLESVVKVDRHPEHVQEHGTNHVAVADGDHRTVRVRRRHVQKGRHGSPLDFQHQLSVRRRRDASRVIEPLPSRLASKLGERATGPVAEFEFRQGRNLLNLQTVADRNRRRGLQRTLEWTGHDCLQGDGFQALAKSPGLLASVFVEVSAWLRTCHVGADGIGLPMADQEQCRHSRAIIPFSQCATKPSTSRSVA